MFGKETKTAILNSIKTGSPDPMRSIAFAARQSIVLQALEYFILKLVAEERDVEADLAKDLLHTMSLTNLSELVERG